MTRTFADAFAKLTPPAVAGVSGSFAMAGQTVQVSAGALTAAYAAGQQVFATLTENVTSVALTGMPASGAIMELVLTQDATGGRTVAWPVSWLAAGGFRPDVSPQPGSISRVLVSTGDGRVFVDFAGLNYR